MVQEFHVLKCFSCDYFQSHIVKKTNKWDCKVCGAKQSIKKVYGRGSGKDCRIHTQKLNVLKGEKDDQNRVNNPALEEDMGQSLLQSDLLDVAQPSEEYQTPTVRSSRWEVFLDKGKSNELRSDCKIQGNKRKRSFELSESNLAEEYGIEMEPHDSVDNIYSDFSFPSSRMHLEQRTNSEFRNKICKNNMHLETSSMNECEIENDLVLKSNKLINGKPPSKVSMKWSKYIEQDEIEYNKCKKTNKIEEHDNARNIFDLNTSVTLPVFGQTCELDDSANKRADLCSEARYCTLNKLNISGRSMAYEFVLKKDQTLPVSGQTCELDDSANKRADLCSEARDSTLNKLNMSGRSMVDEFVLKKDQTLPVSGQTCELDDSANKRADLCSEARDCTLNKLNMSGRSMADEFVQKKDQTLPVFEQTCELDDKDFLLDF